MKLGLSLSPLESLFGPLFFAGDIYRGIDTAASLGFDGVELSLRDPAGVDRKIFTAVKESGLEIFAIATGQSFVNDGLSLASADASVRRQTIERLKGHVENASEFGAAVILGGIIGSMEQADDASLSICCEAIAEVAGYAVGCGATVLLEPINRYETNVFNRLEQAAGCIEEYGLKSARVLADVFHMNIEEASIEQSLREYRKSIGYVHFADSNRLAPGMGHLDFASFVQTLKNTGYDGVIGFEYLPRPDSLSALQKGVAAVRHLLS